MAYSVRGALCGRLVYHIIWLSMIYKTYIVLGHSEYRLQSCTSKAPTCRLRLFSARYFTPRGHFLLDILHCLRHKPVERMNENGMSREKAEG